MSKGYRSGIGVMSGTSLDGLDLAWCSFEKDNSGWRYRIEKACTIPYESAFRERLSNATLLSALDYAQLNVDLGTMIADNINEWIGHEGKPDFIASHGHTVFHQPAQGLTTQIGSGAVIAARTGITTVCDFRTLDVALGGQGAPLVPIGDALLFGQYDACLNLGGFCNISFQNEDRRVAFDISPCNMAMNRIANLLGKPYDEDGNIARNGQSIPELLLQLNQLEYYNQSYPKSLGKEWFEQQFLPLLHDFEKHHSAADTLHTLVLHISEQIARIIPSAAKTLLATGGGALNKFLIQKIQERWGGEIIVPDTLTVNFKEALVFAFLGMLRLLGEKNCLASVTGAKQDNCGGSVYFV
ncbi:MAG: anhydro-N-acetylmuramic acid kinase [Bacteroidales bacterium]|nr:anhydro-N-acetylmuramic acid kinase [Bacteroidales bacterium]